MLIPDQSGIGKATTEKKDFLKMIYFVCEKLTDYSGKIKKIYKQEKRALDCMTSPEIYVLWYNPKFYPAAAQLQPGEIINELLFK